MQPIFEPQPQLQLFQLLRHETSSGQGIPMRSLITSSFRVCFRGTLHALCACRLLVLIEFVPYTRSL